MLLPKDYVRLRLTGERATDVADASGTLLFDVAGRRWSDEVLDALDLPRAWLPRVLESPEVSGETADGVPVAAGAGDQAAGALGVGRRPAGTAARSRSAPRASCSPRCRRFAADPAARVHAFCHAVPGRLARDGRHALRGGVAALVPGRLRARRRLRRADRRRRRAGSRERRGSLYLPYLAGERTPHADPDARGAFVGLTLRHDRGALVRAVLEGVAYGLRDSLELLRGLGVEPQVGRVSGGAARSPLWLAIVASVLGIPLERTAAEEGAAFGAALLGGVAGGVFGDVHEAVASCVRVRDEVRPERSWSSAYDEGYARFRALYPALRAV